MVLKWKNTMIDNGKAQSNCKFQMVTDKPKIGQQFEFKLVKILGNNEVEWEQLPNNSNRKFKPKFNTKLILKWSSHIGQAINEAKSSMKLKGLPGVMVNDHKQGGLLKKKLKKKKKNILSDSDTNSENENDSFCVGRKKSSDIR